MKNQELKNKRCLNCSQPLHTTKAGKTYCTELCKVKFHQKIKTVNNRKYKDLILLLKEYIPQLIIEEDKINLELLVYISQKNIEYKDKFNDFLCFDYNVDKNGDVIWWRLNNGDNIIYLSPSEINNLFGAFNDCKPKNK
jgi:hypothetical protein